MKFKILPRSILNDKCSKVSKNSLQIESNEYTHTHTHTHHTHTIYI